MKNVHIGTSGWSYSHWDEVFYPEEVASNKRLGYYCNFFQTVEINTTFYHLPLVKTVKNWHKQVPKDFIFSVKASRFITHVKRLLDSEEPLQFFYERIRWLKKKLGPILVQLPPSFSKDYERLEAFLHLLDPNYQYVFEFRHATWFDETIYQLLTSHNIALCFTDLNGQLSPLQVTADFVYIRLHGPKRAYKGRYGKQKLNIWKKRILSWLDDKKEIFLYFDNDEKSYAVQDAIALKEMLGDKKALLWGRGG